LEVPLRHRFLLSAALVLATFGGLGAARAETAHDFSFESIDGGALPLAAWSGHPVLVVNTASRCGFTPQYEGLQALWERYRDRGLMVLGVPSNDFGGQEPGSAAEIKDFCETTFAVDFPLAEKSVVVGQGAHPFYAWARDSRPDLATPNWNFHKYLVGGDGRLVAAFATAVDPLAPQITKAIEDALDVRN
jgi:glutathione peroxidase